MISVLTVCGNGIGSSLMLKMKIEEICSENGIDAQVESIDFNAAQGRKADLIVTVKELAEQFDDKNVAIVRSTLGHSMPVHSSRSNVNANFFEFFCFLNCISCCNHNFCRNTTAS